MSELEDEVKLKKVCILSLLNNDRILSKLNRIN